MGWGKVVFYKIVTEAGEKKEWSSIIKDIEIHFLHMTILTNLRQSLFFFFAPFHPHIIKSLYSQIKILKTE